MLLGHMMKHWKNDEKKILRSAAVTSILFGVVHLGNLAYGNTAETIFQVFYATILGMIFAASYLLFERKIYGRAYLFMEL